MPAGPSFRIALVSATLMLAGCGGSNPFSGEPAPLDVQIAHPNGVVLQLLSAGASGDHVVVNARVLNGRDQEVKLAQGTEKSYLLTGSGEKLLTDDWSDEGPSWSPNGRAITFYRSGRGSSGKATLWMVDLTGVNERRIPTPLDGSDPAWGPLRP